MRKTKVFQVPFPTLEKGDLQFEVEEEENKNLIEKEKAKMKKEQSFRSEMASIRGNNKTTQKKMGRKKEAGDGEDKTSVAIPHLYRGEYTKS